MFTFPVGPLWQRTRPTNAAGGDITCKGGFGTINALPGKWDDFTLKVGHAPVGLGITKE